MPQRPKDLQPSRSARERLGAEIRHWRVLRGLSQDQLGALVHISGDLVSKLEKGQRTCKARYAADMDTALETGGAIARLLEPAQADVDNRARDVDNSPIWNASTPLGAWLGGTLEEPRSTSDWNEFSTMLRRNFLAAASAATGALLPLANASSATAVPATVRSADIDQINTAATTLRSWDNLYGGAGVVRDTARAQVQWAASLLSADCPSPLRGGLFTAVSGLAAAVGSSAFDAFAHEDAQRYFVFATLCAEEADNWPSRAVSYNLRSRHATWRGDPDTGLTLAELGLIRADRLSPAERSMLHNARARALAKMGKTQQALAAVGESDDSFAGMVPANEGPWMAYYDSAQHHGDTGHALFDLALLGRPPRSALMRLQTAVDTHTADYARSRTFSRTKLASLRMATGDPAEAVADGRIALAEAAQLRSLRAKHELDELRGLAQRHPELPDARDLREQISSMVTA
ncbi:helix-turn-helix transcriptional regulator [Kitasatospora sp. NPDC048545]|uniref:helix-turn-helix domain-containing protein n=1 Tax=Kitasatospora sp. NPDC048545 TaxID=3157208 RepID=UPI0033EA51EB